MTDRISRSQWRRRRLAIVFAYGIPLFLAHGVSAVTFTDATGDNYGPSYVDIASVDVTSDATNLTFQINLNPSANLLASDGSQIYGKYQIGFQTGEAGNTTAMNPYGNPIGITSGTGMDYWIGSWADNSSTAPFGGGAQLFQYAGTTATQVAGIGTNAPYIDVPVTLAATSTTIVIPLASLNLAQGDSFKFDVWTTFGQPGGQSAYDALGKATLTTDPGTPYSPVTPYDSGTALLSYTVGAATPVNASWASTGGGNWSAGANWSGGVAPNGVDSTATFGSSIAAPTSVTVDGPKTVGSLTFNSAIGYTLSGTDPITLDVSTGGAAVNVLAGSHTIEAPVTLADDTTINVSPVASTIAFHGALTAGGKNITKTGGGTATFVNIRAGGLSVQGGTIRTPAQASSLSAAGTSVVTSLAISSGATLDIANNALVIDYSTLGTLPADVRGLLGGGRLVSGGASSNSAIGYVNNGVGTARTSFGGISVDSTSILVAVTLKGDANLSRTVDFNDLVILAQNYNTPSGATWQQGDFNYDGAVNFNDLVPLAQNYNGTPSLVGLSSDFVADWELARSLAPEPTVLGGLLAVALFRRRRTR